MTETVSFAWAMYRAIEGMPCIEWADGVMPMNVLELDELEQTFAFMAGRCTHRLTRSQAPG